MTGPSWQNEIRENVNFGLHWQNLRGARSALDLLVKRICGYDVLASRVFESEALETKVTANMLCITSGTKPRLPCQRCHLVPGNFVVIPCKQAPKGYLFDVSHVLRQRIGLENASLLGCQRGKFPPCRGKCCFSASITPWNKVPDKRLDDM